MGRAKAAITRCDSDNRNIASNGPQARRPRLHAVKVSASDTVASEIRTDPQKRPYRPAARPRLNPAVQSGNGLLYPAIALSSSAARRIVFSLPATLKIFKVTL
jgi:hypothetical protein